MTDRDKKLVARILSACTRAKKRGLTIVYTNWGVNGYSSGRYTASVCCCPLGAVLLNKRIRDAIYGLSVARLLAVSENWVNGFINEIGGINHLTYNLSKSYLRGIEVAKEVKLKLEHQAA